VVQSTHHLFGNVVQNERNRSFGPNLGCRIPYM